eukprot:scaffold10327_cov70-Phaeocystis_antarctica.AAC.1
MRLADKDGSGGARARSRVRRVRRNCLGRMMPLHTHSRLRRWRRRCRACLGEAADDAAKADVRNDLLALQRGTRARRGVLGAEPICDGRALVGEPVRCADGVGHDLGSDWAHEVVGHLRCPACLRRAGRPAAAALAAGGHRSLQRVGFRHRHCRRRHRLHSLLTRLGRRRDPHRL